MTENEMSSGSSEAALLCDQMFHHNQNCTTNEQWQHTDVLSLAASSLSLVNTAIYKNLYL